jgi:hypothetical protein
MGAAEPDLLLLKPVAVSVTADFNDCQHVDANLPAENGVILANGARQLSIFAEPALKEDGLGQTSCRSVPRL